jgi:hypothetical protein
MIATLFDVEVVHEMADGTVTEKGTVSWTGIETATARETNEIETESGIASVTENA